MNGLNEEMLRMVRRNKLVGMWAAEKLGLVGESAKAYSDDLGMSALDLNRSNVLSKIREDFNAAGVVQSDEQILHVMNQFLLEAATEFFRGRRGANNGYLPPRFTLAVLHQHGEAGQASNDLALEKFALAGEALGLGVEFIGP